MSSLGISFSSLPDGTVVIYMIPPQSECFTDSWSRKKKNKNKKKSSYLSRNLSSTVTHYDFELATWRRLAADHLYTLDFSRKEVAGGDITIRLVFNGPTTTTTTKNENKTRQHFLKETIFLSCAILSGVREMPKKWNFA